ncbi:MAG TPA: hypothetical protein ENF64_03085 [Hadesarchaea archaeon]|nr:hypothetical protein [Hadesarchaea archaeon]
MMSKELDPLFGPKSVVVLGASDAKDVGNVPAMFFRWIVSNISKFTRGKVYGVDLSGNVEGYERSLAKVPKGQDLAVVSLSKVFLAKNLSALIGKKIKALVLLTNEVDRRQRKVLENLAGKRKIILLGPGASGGMVNTTCGLVLVPASVSVPRRGNISIVSQDGGLAIEMLDWACSNRVGISKLVCTGEEMGIGLTDVVGYLANDRETKCICVYLDELGNGRKFIESVREATKRKPVVVLYGGMEYGDILASALRQVKAFQAKNVREALLLAEGLAKQPPMHGNRVAVVTNLAGKGKLLVKHLSLGGLIPAQLSSEISKKISARYGNVNITTFVDLGVGARGDAYRYSVEQLLSDKNVDGVIVITSFAGALLEQGEVGALADVAKRFKDKPVVVMASTPDDHSRAREVLADTKLPVCGSPEEATLLMRSLYVYGKISEKAR